MKQNKGGHPVVPVEKSNNSASRKQLCVSKLSPCRHQQHVETSPTNQCLTWVCTALTLTTEEYALLAMHIPRDKMGCPGGRAASNPRRWPPQESAQQVSHCWKRFSDYLNAASQQTKKSWQSSETRTASLVCCTENTPAIQWWE